MAQASVNFDRAAGCYDATRGFPPETEAEVTALLAAELAGRGRCLEIGVGTGRIAVPLRRSGIDICGVDISVSMLGELLRKGESGPLPWISYADATALPFDDGSFGAGLACHVLHLVAGWERAVRELVRVVEGGGVLLIGLGGSELPLIRAVRGQLAIESGRTQADPGLIDPEVLEALMAALGARSRRLAPVPRRERTTLRAHLQWLESNGSAATWELDEATRIAAIGRVREWAQRECGDLDTTIVDAAPVVFRAYDLPR
ncbi:MAG: class I SAM-dependent methyltransferase [Chloroflexi bacterium]|nr:MAG: class I SAM-dependent methyltransferase [Chloroflexota bacterium]